MKKLFALAVICLSIVGCATQPRDLGSTYVPVEKYAEYDCKQLVDETTNINRRLSELYVSLKKKADNDAVQMGIGLILFWPTLFALEGGDGPEAVEYSRLKGEYEAIRQSSVIKECPADSIPEFKSPEDFKKEQEEAEQETDQEKTTYND